MNRKQRKQRQQTHKVAEMWKAMPFEKRIRFWACNHSDFFMSIMPLWELYENNCITREQCFDALTACDLFLQQFQKPLDDTSKWQLQDALDIQQKMKERFRELDR